MSAIAVVALVNRLSYGLMLDLSLGIYRCALKTVFLVTTVREFMDLPIFSKPLYTKYGQSCNNDKSRLSADAIVFQKGDGFSETIVVLLQSVGIWAIVFQKGNGFSETVVVLLQSVGVRAIVFQKGNGFSETIFVLWQSVGVRTIVF